ncbi:hypothetical protein CRYUN_Cryun29cG0036200 [Craigia yunnanensis]
MCRQKGKTLEQWTLPEDDWIRINCDGDFDTRTKDAGVSVVKENERKVVDGTNKRFQAENALVTEAMALKLTWRWKRNFKRLLNLIHVKRVELIRKNTNAVADWIATQTKEICESGWTRRLQSSLVWILNSLVGVGDFRPL